MRTITHAEDHPRNPVAVEIASHFPQAMPKRSTMWASDWPTRLDLLDITSYRPAIFKGD